MPSILFFRKATKTFTYLSGNEKDIYKAKWKSWISEISDKGLLASQKNLSNDGVLVSGKDQDVRYKPYMDDNEDLVTSYLIIETTNQHSIIEMLKTCPIFDVEGCVEIREIEY